MDTAPWEQRHRVLSGKRFTEPRLTAGYPDIADAPQELLHTAPTPAGTASSATPTPGSS
ncbi:hypothetical protein ACIOD2_41440 [Amycolatopsis sp. NPDC088138]|uniref:hypothetical protein n=1 Tax=Amycolatopsis sp. NPDC088138 TaxID=3363938 RepID=UPI0038052E29